MPARLNPCGILPPAPRAMAPLSAFGSCNGDRQYRLDGLVVKPTRTKPADLAFIINHEREKRNAGYQAMNARATARWRPTVASGCPRFPCRLHVPFSRQRPPCPTAVLYHKGVSPRSFPIGTGEKASAFVRPLTVWIGMVSARAPSPCAPYRRSFGWRAHGVAGCEPLTTAKNVGHPV